MPQDIPAICDGCGKKLSIEHALSCPKVGVWHDDAAKEWGALGARALIRSAIAYEPKINSRKVQGERTGDRVRQEGGEADGGMETVGRAVNGAAILIWQPGQVVVPAESRTDVSAHGFWKRGRGRGPGPERGRKGEKQTAAQKPSNNPKGGEEGRLTGRLD